MTPRRRILTDASLAVMLAGLIVLGVRAQVQPAVVLLPIIQTSMTAPMSVPHPAGVVCFDKAAPVAEDRAGRLFVTCQAENQQGQVVWIVENNEARLLFTGGKQYAGPGIFAMLRSGQLVLSTVGELNSNTTWLVPIPEWTP